MKRQFVLSYLFSALLFLMSQQILAAACCGGCFAAPSIIAGDDKAQLTSSLSLTEVVVDNVDAQGIWRKSDVHQTIQTFKIEAAHIFLDRYQAGLSVPIIKRSQNGTNYSGIGDVAASVGYEYLPDWNYNRWRPKGIGFLQLIVPTGKSRADSEVGGLDSRGNGFWALGAGTLLTKTWTEFDTFLSVEVHSSFAKNISHSQFSGKLDPGYGGNFGVGLGYNVNDYRIGSAITWTYEDALKTVSSTGLVNAGSIERYATALFGVSFMADEEWSGTLNYTDQTLFGEPVNTSLGKGIALQLQRRWGR